MSILVSIGRWFETNNSGWMGDADSSYGTAYSGKAFGFSFLIINIYIDWMLARVDSYPD